MATLVHESPLGALEIPTVGDAVPPGAAFDVDDDIALSLLTQGEIFRLAAPPKIGELRKLATEADIDHDGLTARQLVTALAIAQINAALTNTDPGPTDPDAPPASTDTETTTEEVPA